MRQERRLEGPLFPQVSSGLSGLCPLSPTLTLQGGREGNHGIAQSQLTLPREKASEMLDSSLPVTEAALAGQGYSCAENDIISSI